MKQASTMVAALWLAVMAMVVPGPARAASEEDLLPVDQAYVLTAKAVDEGYVVAHVSRLQELTAQRRIADLKSRLQRLQYAMKGAA